MASPLSVLIDMIFLLLDNTIGTIQSLFVLFQEFFGGLMGISEAGGMPTFIFSVVIIGLVVFFLAKFFFKSAKTILLLVVVGIAMIAVLFLSLV
ncbi:MAG: hypothetical protein JW754_00940 [Candidatus Aenigmarchaeota archaeon]|nr:hypothetical protein [Candidatus Aenigmarchaeota archaeon]